MFRFTDDCILGVEQIDEEHRHLFELINEGYDLLHNEYKADRYADIKKLLEELEQYAELHFEHEESYMEKLRDPELIMQRTQHMFFKEKVQECLMHNIDVEENQQDVLEEIMQFLARWLYHHILSSDILIGKLPPLEEWMIRENPCEFTGEYMTGIDMIDREHKILFEIADRANRLIRYKDTQDKYDQIMEILAELKEYTQSHFADEEEYMESIGYAGLEAQKRAHEAFIDKLNHISEEKTEGNPQRYLESLMEFLLGWLINHILYSDKLIPKKE